MTFEVEVKAWVTDPRGVENRLNAEASFAGEIHKSDIYFRLPQGPPLQQLRLRREGQTDTVTLKRKSLVDGVEVNEERAFEVSDASAFCTMLDRFGFEPYAVKSKASRLYRAGNVTLELCEVGGLGHFLEIEILCENEADTPTARQEVLGWLARLGISGDAIEPTPYTRLLAEQHPARYVFTFDDPDTLVRSVPHTNAGRQGRLL